MEPNLRVVTLLEDRSMDSPISLVWKIERYVSCFGFIAPFQTTITKNSWLPGNRKHIFSSQGLLLPGWWVVRKDKLPHLSCHFASASLIFRLYTLGSKQSINLRPLRPLPLHLYNSFSTPMGRITYKCIQLLKWPSINFISDTKKKMFSIACIAQKNNLF